MKIKFTIFILTLLWLSDCTRAQTLRRPIASGYTGMGAYSLHNLDVFSFTANPAALSQLNAAAAGVYGERRFLLSELNNYTAVIGLPTSSGNFGLKAGYSGFSDYNETQIGLAYARKLGEKVDIGAQFNYNGIRISGYGNASAISFELGTILHITDKLHTGLHISNPVGGKFGKDQEEKLSSVYTVGIGYEASENFLLTMEIEKEEDRPVNVNGSFQYKFLPQLMTRAGISSASSTAWIGLGILLRSFRLDITTSYHPQLGITPGLLLMVPFSHKAVPQKETD